MSQWVDFQKLKESLDFVEVLRHYGVKLKADSRDQRQLRCPLPTHSGTGKTPSFSANVPKKIWQCFGCGARGNVLDFAVRMEGGDPAKSADVRKTALGLQKHFATAEHQRPPGYPKPAKAGTEVSDAGGHTAPSADRVVVNAPIDFELKGLDAEHPYLHDRGFTPETLARFGLGYCNRGLMKHRVVIPLHDQAGARIGYAGRVTDDSTISDKNPKYRFPSDREHNGVTYEFHKSKLLYNAYRIKGPVHDLVVVEGFASVWWLVQNEFPNAAAFMGASCSVEQACIIADLVHEDGCVWVFSDGDDAGDRCAGSAFLHIGGLRRMRYVPIDRGKQPTDYDGDRLRRMLTPMG